MPVYPSALPGTLKALCDKSAHRAVGMNYEGSLSERWHDFPVTIADSQSGIAFVMFFAYPQTMELLTSAEIVSLSPPERLALNAVHLGLWPRVGQASQPNVT